MFPSVRCWDQERQCVALVQHGADADHVDVGLVGGECVDRDIFAHVQYTFVRGHDVRAGDDASDELGFDRARVI